MLNMEKRVLSLGIVLGLLACAHSPLALARGGQTAKVDGGRDRTADTRPLKATEDTSPSEDAAIQAQINSVYQTFFNSYRLGAGDAVAIYIDKHSEDSVPRAVVSPVGQIYYPAAWKCCGCRKDYVAASGLLYFFGL
jgi:hypothetical protein